MRELSGLIVPADPGPFKRAEDRWKSYVDEPGDSLIFAGHALTHTDWAADNVLIATDRAWLIDWAWPALGAAWTDPACWLLRLMAAGGRTAAQAEHQAARLPAYATADPAYLDLFARVNARMWDQIAPRTGATGPERWPRPPARGAHTDKPGEPDEEGAT